MSLNRLIRTTDSKRRIASCLIALGMVSLLGACPSSKIASVRPRAEGVQLPRPDRVIIYDFGTTMDEMKFNRSPESGAGQPWVEPDKVDDERRHAMSVADVIAIELMHRLESQGISASRWHGPPPADGKSIGIEGRFLGISEGDSLKRNLIGFGLGRTELETDVEFSYLAVGVRMSFGRIRTVAKSSRKPGFTTPISAAGERVIGGARMETDLRGPLARNAEDTAKQIAELVFTSYQERGWLP